jgi:corrinoid protein of di/trimethylamine methyltransferase
MSTMLEKLKQAIVEGEDDEAIAGAEAALEAGVAPLEVLNQAIVAGIEEAGRLWNNNRYFLPDVILSAGAFREALEVVEPHLAQGAGHGAGRVLFGVVAGDMHDLGKNIVTAMLTGAGFEIVDLGVDVPIQTFVDKVAELEPDVVGLGAYMTTTMLLMKDVIEGLSGNGLRDKVKVMIGGVPTSQEFADEIGADAWGKDALDAVAKARQLVGVDGA